ncbi:MAG TPA: radical SAM protein [Vicinamibacteria bacterium]|nr:radical SAM protein [Vicinamibacteria bacterium]
MSAFPRVPLLALDTLWLQVAGTLCNLRCAHCFISCSPDNDAHHMMDRATVARFLDEAEALGVRDYYFTGGEPFLNREIFEMTADALAKGPLSILTNGVLLTPEWCARLRELSDASTYSLDLRISIDGWDAATNDPIRGEGTFERILWGIGNLAEAGLNPVVTVTEACDGAGGVAGRTRLLSFLRAIGLDRPRLKVMPLLRLGVEERRTRAYGPGETLRGTALSAEDVDALQCSSSRMVTSRGVYVCPILLDFEAARLADSLAGSLRPFELEHPACHTCHVEGLSCRT